MAGLPRSRNVHIGLPAMKGKKMKKRIFAAILAAAMTFSAVPTLLPAAQITVSAASSKKLDAPKNLKVSKKTDSSVTLKWSKVEGADKYAVYRYDSKTKKYVKIKSVSKTSYTVTGLDSGTKYQFKVAALVKGKDGKYTAQTQSEAKSVTTAEYPSFVMPKYGAKKSDTLKSMGKNNFVKITTDDGDTYTANVMYNGKEALCMLIFNEDNTVKGYVLMYDGVSRKAYNKLVDEFDEKYGTPVSEYGDSSASTKMWTHIDLKKKEATGIMLVYDTESQSIMEAFAYAYGSGVGSVFDGVAA